MREVDAGLGAARERMKLLRPWRLRTRGMVDEYNYGL